MLVANVSKISLKYTESLIFKGRVWTIFTREIKDTSDNKSMNIIIMNTKNWAVDTTYVGQIYSI